MDTSSEELHHSLLIELRHTGTHELEPTVRVRASRAWLGAFFFFSFAPRLLPVLVRAGRR